jgi:hypothetical protein
MKRHEPRNLFKPDSPVSNLAPAVQAFAAANLLSSHLGDLRKITLNLDLTATIEELEFQLSALDDAVFLYGEKFTRPGVERPGFNPTLARTRMQNCLTIAIALRRCLKDTDAIALATVEARPAGDGPPPPDDKKARRREYLLECGREDLAREEGLL